MKTIFFLPLSLCLITTLSADSVRAGAIADDGDYTALQARVEKLEKEPRTLSSYRDIGVAERRGNVYLEGELLYWKISEENLSIAMQTSEEGEIINGHVVHPDFQWEPGFRLGAGISFSGTNSDARVRWTHNSSNIHDNSVPTPPNVFEGLNHNAKSFDFRWKSKLDMGDIALGHTIALNKHFQARPFAALQAIRLTQNTEATYFGSEMTTVVDPYQWILKQQSRFCGLGPVVGADLLWTCYKGFSIYGTGAGMLYYGRVSSSQIQQEKELVAAPFESSFSFDDSLYTNKFGYNLGVGARFDGSFSADSVHVGFALGWELLSLPDQNQWSRTMTLPNTNALGNIGGAFNAQGLVLKLVVGF